VRFERFDKAAPTRPQCEAFDCGEPSLNRWLSNQAAESMNTRFAVTYLLVDEDDAIAGYFCLSSGEVRRPEAPAALARRAPDPIPVIRMGRFAVRRELQGQGWGAELLREALLRAASVSGHVGARALLVDAIGDDARRFYLRFGFITSPIHPLQLLYDLRVVASSAGAEDRER
jgi:GNAT superfamily N-acetyltransferase